jgi:hypothetical protein
MNYMVVIFKDKIKKRLIKKFVTFEKAKHFYDSLLNESKDVIFDKIIEDGKEVKFEIGIVELSNKQLIPVYLTDEFGRNVKVKLEEDGMTLFSISPYKIEEKIFDVKQNKKITIEKFIRNYLSGDGLKMISSLNNKIVVQHDSVFNLFTTKSESESWRFIDCLSTYFYSKKRKDCLFVKDNSTPQKKYLYDILEKNGFDKKVLYRKFTSLPSRRE